MQTQNSPIKEIPMEMRGMNGWDSQYIGHIKDIINNGHVCPSRTGENVHKKLNIRLFWDLADGFPLLTFRQMPWKGIRVELEGFLKGITDKKWYQDNGCSFWNEWGNQKYVKAKLEEWKREHPSATPSEIDDARKEMQLEERDMYSGYGFDWRHYGAEYDGYDKDYTGQGVDQLARCIEIIKRDPNDRRILIVGYNPEYANEYAMPACISFYQFSVLDGRLHLTYHQRSADMVLGAPNDFAQAALFLSLAAQTTGLIPGTVTGNLVHCDIYASSFDAIKNGIEMPSCKILPTLELEPGTDVFNFTWDNAKLKDYHNGPRIIFDRSV